MFPAPRSRARQLIVAAMVGISLSVAACSDDVTAPKAPAVAHEMGGASEALLKVAAMVKVRVVDTAGNTLTEPSWVDFTTTNPADTVAVRDNDPKDLDPAVGFIKVALGKAQSYRGCMRMSQHYRGDPAYNSAWPRCTTVASNAINIDLSKVYARQSPQVVFLMKNQFGTLVGGASVNLAVAAQNWSLTFSDNNVSYDENATNGNITYTMGYPNAYTWCEIDAPPKHLLLSAKCGSFNAKWGSKFTIVLNHEQQIF